MKVLKNYRVFLLTLIMLIMTSTTVLAGEVAEINAEKFGLWTILPPLVAIALAFITKNVVISLFIGTLSGCFLLQITGTNPFNAIIQAFLDFVQRALNSLADPCAIATMAVAAGATFATHANCSHFWVVTKMCDDIDASST